MSYHRWEAACWGWDRHVHLLRGEFEEKHWMIPERRAYGEAQELAIKRGLDPETVEVMNVETVRENDPRWWVVHDGRG